MTGTPTTTNRARHAVVAGLTIGALALGSVTLAGCSLPLAKTASVDRAVSALVIVDTHAHRSASDSTSQFSGELHGQVLNGRACFWIEHDGVPPTMLIWPLGYRAKTDPLRLLDSHGGTVATVGTKLAGTGSPNALTVTQSCAGTIMATYLVDGIGGTLANPPATVPTYGNAGYRTSAKARKALDAVAKVARKAHAVGSYRSGERSMTIRLPRGSHASTKTRHVGHFAIHWERSRFRAATLTSTLRTVRRLAQTGMSPDALYAVDYDASRDRVIVAGQLTPDAAKSLKAVPGVLVSSTTATAQG